MEKKKKTNKKFIIIVSVLVIVAIIIGSYEYIHSLSHETTDDAQVKTNMNPIIPRVAGYIDKVYVHDNQHIKKGDTLFVIDDKDYNVKLEQAKATLAEAESQKSVAKASIGSSQANVETSTAEVSSATGNIETAKIRLRRATNDFERYKNLYDNHSITKQQYEKALAAKQEAEQQVQILKNRQTASASQRNAAVSQKDITKKRVSVADAKIKSAQAMVDAAKLDMGYTVVTAPISGQLSEVDLQKGQYVQPGQSLFYLVNTSKKWVIANFKETQLDEIRVGQNVDMKVDAYPDVEFKGKVSAISPATGARFSLLPPDNATGNFVKTVQRLPVKIELTKDNKKEDIEKIRSGMNVEVDVHTK